MLIHGNILCKFRIFLKQSGDVHRFYNEYILS